MQFEYSLVERSGDRDNLPMAEALGIGAALWSPLGGGLLTGKYRTSSEGRLTEWNRLVHNEDEPIKAATVDAVLAVAEDSACPPAQVAVAWLLERARRSPTGIVPIIGPRTVEQLDDYLAALDLRLGSTTSTTGSTRSAASRSASHTSQRRKAAVRGPRRRRLQASARSRLREDPAQPGDPAVEEGLRHRGLRRDGVETVECAWHQAVSHGPPAA